MNNQITTQGENRGDITRDTHQPLKRFSRVLQQQGRVLLDADWNEQTSILLRYLRTLAGDLIGEHGGPKTSFAVGVDPKDLGLTKQEVDDMKLNLGDFIITKGHYYVAGILCENENHLTYTTQPDNPGTAIPVGKANAPYLVYLDVWERHVNYLQDADANNPGIREVALGGIDTTTRAQVVWQVRTTEAKFKPSELADYQNFLGKIDALTYPGSGLLQARAKQPVTDGEVCPCVTSPEARYRGTENQLYRVEIHQAGVAWNNTVNKKTGEAAGNIATAATFKWSRENSSVDFAIRQPVDSGNGTTTVMLVQLGRDARRNLEEGDWVEIVDDISLLQPNPGTLLKVTLIERDEGKVTLQGMPAGNVGQDTTKHPLLRRWNHRSGQAKNGGLTLGADGAALVQEGADDGGWLNLEKGVQIRFTTQKDGARYAPGDYWLIPARVATGDVEWPGPANDPAALPPHGIEHHYAPLAIINLDASGKIASADNCRRTFDPLAK